MLGLQLLPFLKENQQGGAKIPPHPDSGEGGVIHLRNFFRKNKPLFCYQFGFQNGYSVSHAVTSCVLMMKKNLHVEFSLIYRKPSTL